MVLDKLIPSAIIAIGLFGGSSVAADSKDPKHNAAGAPLEEGQVIDGSVEPEEIYDSVKYRLFISHYGWRARDALAEKISFEDQEVLRSLAVRDSIDQEPIDEAYSQARRHLCANRGSMSPVEIARESKRIVDEWLSRTEARYRKGLDALSKPGREVVERFVATEIVPGIKTEARSDAIQKAKEDPEGFMEAVEVECYYVENGELPPGMQEQVDEFFSEMDEEERQDDTK